MPIPVRHFYMIRHGETEANAARLMAGSLDSPLTENGKNQAKSVQPILKSLTVKPQIIVHSQLSRARDTAGILNEALKVPMTEDPEFAEMCAGEWEGVPYEQCRFMMKDWASAPGGETFEDFFARIKRAKNRILGHQSAPPLIVSHGGVFRAFWKIYGLHSEGVKNCVLYEFKPHNSQAGIFPWRIFRHAADEIVEVEISDNALSETDW